MQGWPLEHVPAHSEKLLCYFLCSRALKSVVKNSLATESVGFGHPYDVEEAIA